MDRTYLFPKGFLWGSASSAFQVEGGCTNHDFYDWALRGNIKDKSSPEDAVRFWEYYKKDIGLMKKMNHSTARIGVEWARIEPEEGEFDEKALVHYRDILKEMRKSGIAPMVTLHHFANPMWLVRMGGWTSGKAAGYFKRFAEKTVRSLGDLSDLWITINEPAVYAVAAYLYGEFPPGRKNIYLAFKVQNHLAEAHCEAYRSIHEIYWQKKWGKPKVGIAKHLRPFDPFNESSLLDRFAAKIPNRLFNDYFLDKVMRPKSTLDLFGINYYSGDLVKFPMKMVGRDALPKNDLGWDIYPEGFYRILTKYYRLYRLPLYITENGICDNTDRMRPRYILDHVYQMHRAVGDGAGVAAYYHWSTMDNFELVEGLSQRFGLVHVDHDHPERKRTLKASGELYGAVARANGITEALVRKYLPGWQRDA